MESNQKQAIYSKQIDDETLRFYRAKISAIPLLTPKEERILTQQIKKQQQSIDPLVEANLRLVVSIAGHYRQQWIPQIDLIQEGNIGLIKAAKRFDPDRGYRFSTFATPYIRKAIKRALDEKARIIRIPVGVEAIIYQINKAEEALKQSNKREATDREIAEMLALEEEKVKQIRHTLPETTSLEESAGKEPISYYDFLKDEKAEDPFDIVMGKVINRTVQTALKTLPDTEAQVLRLRYGFGESTGISYAKIGHFCHINGERARNMEARALRRLKETPIKKQLEALINI